MKHVLIVLFVLMSFLSAQNLNPEKDIIYSGYFQKLQNNDYQFLIMLEITPGLHITEGDYFYLDVLEDDQVVRDLSFSGKTDYNGHGVFTGTTKIQFKSEILPENMGNNLFELGYQACSEGLNETCFPPISKELKLTDFKEDATKFNNSVAKTKGSSEEGKEKAIETNENKSLEEKLFSFLGIESEEGKISQGLKWSLWIFLFAFLGGILDSMTPCVYPIIPVVISYMGARSGSKKRAGFFLSLFFVLGLSITYSLVGLLASFVGDKFGVGTFAGNPWVMGSIATIFFVLSLSMFGFYDINLMSSSQKTSLMQKNFTGPLGAIFLGAISGVIAAPCVGPVLAALLLHVTMEGDILYGWLLLMTFAFGLGLLFLVIGTFSGAMNSLPKAGAWMVNIKKFFGLLMVGAALYFVKALFPVDLYNLIIGLVIIFFSYFLVVKESASSSFQNFVKTLNFFLKTIALILIISAITNAFNITLPGSNNSQIVSENKVNFHKEDQDTDIIQKFAAKSKDSGKLIIVDVWAEWCTNCKVLDKTIWNDEEVINIIEKRYLPLKLDFTRTGSEFYKHFLKKFHNEGVANPPVIMIFDEHQNLVWKHVGLLSKEKIIPVLKEFGKK